VEALEALHEAKLMKGPANLKVTFDEYKVALALNYPGGGISFARPRTTIDLKKLMEDGEGEKALDAAMSNISAKLIQNLADVVKCDESGDRATLHLQFSH
jgi:hypothetical protein